jgi:hypothetical protein
MEAIGVNGLMRQRYVLLTPLTFTVEVAPAFAQFVPFTMVAACETVPRLVEARSTLTKSVATDFFNIFFLLSLDL